MSTATSAAETWSNPNHDEWLALSSRLGGRVNLVAERSDLVVAVRPRQESADRSAPGEFDPHRATIRVCATQTLPGDVHPGTIDPTNVADRARYPILSGVSSHEAAHAAHTRWVEHLPGTVSWSELATAKLLEEARIEGCLIARRPSERAYLRASATHLVAGDVDLREADVARAAQAAALLLARVDAGVFTEAEMTTVECEVAAAMGTATLQALRAVWRDALECSDEDAMGMLTCARRWNDLIADPDEDTGDPTPDSEALAWSCGHHSEAPDRGSESTHAEAVGGALNDVAEDAAAQLAEEAGLAPAGAHSRPAANPHEHAARISQASTTVFGAGRQSASIIVRHQQPSNDDQGQARALRAELRRASYRGAAVSRTPQVAPPGRLRTGRLMQRSAQLAAGVTVTATPWEKRQRRMVEQPPLTVGVAVDVSASMDAFMQPAGDAAWVISEGVAAVGGATAAVAWNGAVEPLLAPGRRATRKPVPTISGGSSGLPQALDALDGALKLHSRGGARLVVVVTDGALPNYLEVEERIAGLVRQGVHVLWLTPTSGRGAEGALHVPVPDPSQLGHLVGHHAAAQLRNT